MMWWWSWVYSRFWIMTKSSIGSSDLNNRKIWLCLTLRNLSHNWSLTWCTLQIIWSWSIFYDYENYRELRLCVTDSWVNHQTCTKLESNGTMGFCAPSGLPFWGRIPSYPMPHQNPASSSWLFWTFVLVRRHCTRVTESARKFCLGPSKWVISDQMCTLHIMLEIHESFIGTEHD